MLPWPRMLADPPMPAADPWQNLRAELDVWQAAGRTARLWLRDDDAMAPTPDLDRLLDICRRHQAPLLLCVIPLRAEDNLPGRLVEEALVEIAAHGAWHCNHAPLSRKSEEMAPERGDEVILADLHRARTRLVGLFGEAAGTWYVPPWNRITPGVAALLPLVGFRALSTFAEASHGCTRLAEHNTHVDLIDWRNGRTGRSAGWIAARLTEELAKARAHDFQPVGLLTHHLEHDDTAWATLEQVLNQTRRHAAVRWVSASDLLEA